MIRVCAVAVVTLAAVLTLSRGDEAMMKVYKSDDKDSRHMMDMKPMNTKKKDMAYAPPKENLPLPPPVTFDIVIYPNTKCKKKMKQKLKRIVDRSSVGKRPHRRHPNDDDDDDDDDDDGRALLKYQPYLNFYSYTRRFHRLATRNVPKHLKKAFHKRLPGKDSDYDDDDEDEDVRHKHKKPSIFKLHIKLKHRLLGKLGHVLAWEKASPPPRPPPSSSPPPATPPRTSF